MGKGGYSEVVTATDSIEDVGKGRGVIYGCDLTPRVPAPNQVGTLT